MKKITTTIIFIVLALTLAGCGNNIVTKSIEQANTAIESKNYDKALVALELALDEDYGNEEAKNLYSILESYQRAKKAIKEDIDALKNQVEEKKEKENKVYPKSEVNSILSSLNKGSLGGIGEEDKNIHGELCYVATITWLNGNRIRSFWIGSKTLTVYNSPGEVKGSIYAQQNFDTEF